MVVNAQARRTEISVWEAERQVHTKLFLQERDHWPKSSMHLLSKMLYSAEYADVKE